MHVHHIINFNPKINVKTNCSKYLILVKSRIKEQIGERERGEKRGKGGRNEMTGLRRKKKVLLKPLTCSSPCHPGPSTPHPQPHTHFMQTNRWTPSTAELGCAVNPTEEKQTLLGTQVDSITHNTHTSSSDDDRLEERIRLHSLLLLYSSYTDFTLWLFVYYASNKYTYFIYIYSFNQSWRCCHGKTTNLLLCMCAHKESFIYIYNSVSSIYCWCYLPYWCFGYFILSAISIHLLTEWRLNESYTPLTQGALPSLNSRGCCWPTPKALCRTPIFTSWTHTEEHKEYSWVGHYCFAAFADCPFHALFFIERVLFWDMQLEFI